MIGTALDDFYLSPSELEASPSRAAGVSLDLELTLRRYGCDAIAEAVVLLRLPQAVACTAQVLVHRFYCKRPLTKFDVKPVAIAALWLAAKLEECVEVDSPTKLRLRDVLFVLYRVYRRRDGRPLMPLDPYSQRYDELKTEVVRVERHMLRALGFIVHIEHPHRFVLTFGQLLGLEKEVLQEGWNLANDSLRTTLCVRHKAEAVACGLLFLAARRRHVALPERPPWWKVFGVTEEQLLEVASEVLELLKLPKPEYVALGLDLTSSSGDAQAATVGGAAVEGAGAKPDEAAAASGGMLAAATAAVAAIEAGKNGNKASGAAASGEPFQQQLQQRNDDGRRERRSRSRSRSEDRKRRRSRSDDRRQRQRRERRSRSRSRDRRRHRSSSSHHRHHRRASQRSPDRDDRRRGRESQDSHRYRR